MPDWSDRAARRMYEGAGLGPEDVDIFNPYDGYAPMAQFPYGHVHDSIEQLRGTAGARQVRVRAETALAAFTTPSNGGWIMFGKSPS